VVVRAQPVADDRLPDARPAAAATAAGRPLATGPGRDRAAQAGPDVSDPGANERRTHTRARRSPPWRRGAARRPGQRRPDAAGADAARRAGSTGTCACCCASAETRTGAEADAAAAEVARQAHAAEHASAGTRNPADADADTDFTVTVTEPRAAGRRGRTARTDAPTCVDTACFDTAARCRDAAGRDAGTTAAARADTGAVARHAARPRLRRQEPCTHGAAGADGPVT